MYLFLFHEILGELLKGGRGGTIFHPHPEPITNRQSWLAYALQPVGEIYLDQGAYEAIQERGASLLLVGINKVIGNSFESFETISPKSFEGKVIAPLFSIEAFKEV